MKDKDYKDHKDCKNYKEYRDYRDYSGYNDEGYDAEGYDEYADDDEYYACVNRTRTVRTVSLRIIFAAVCIFLIYFAVVLSFRFGHALFYQEPMEDPPGKDVEITIEQDMGIGAVAQLLKDEGLIDNQLAFELQGRLYKASVYPGTYTLNTSMNSKEMLEKLNMTEEEYLEKQKQE